MVSGGEGPAPSPVEIYRYPSVAEVEAAAVMAPRPEFEDDLLARGIDHGRIGPAHREPRDDRAVGQVVLQDIANVNIAIFVELWMKDQAVERGQVGMQLGEVEREVGLLAAGIVREGEDPALELAEEEPVGPLGRDQHDRELELEVGKGRLDGVRRRRLGRAGDLRAGPGDAAFEGAAERRPLSRSAQTPDLRDDVDSIASRNSRHESAARCDAHPVGVGRCLGT